MVGTLRPMTATRHFCEPAPLDTPGAGVGFGEYAALAQLLEHRIRNTKFHHFHLLLQSVIMFKTSYECYMNISNAGYVKILDVTGQYVYQQIIVRCRLSSVGRARHS